MSQSDEKSPAAKVEESNGEKKPDSEGRAKRARTQVEFYKPPAQLASSSELVIKEAS
jgi:hypothetical protein